MEKYGVEVKRCVEANCNNLIPPGFGYPTSEGDICHDCYTKSSNDSMK